MLEKLVPRTDYISWTGRNSEHDALASDETTAYYRTACMCLDILDFLSDLPDDRGLFRELECPDGLAALSAVAERTGKAGKLTEKATKLICTLLERMEENSVKDYVASIGARAFVREPPEQTSPRANGPPPGNSPTSVYEDASKGRLNLALMGILHSILDGFPERSAMLVGRRNTALAEFLCHQFSYGTFTSNEMEGLSWCVSAMLEDSVERSRVFASWQFAQRVLASLVTGEALAWNALFACVNMLAVFLSPHIGTEYGERTVKEFGVYLENVGDAIAAPKLYNLVVVVGQMLLQRGSLADCFHETSSCASLVRAISYCASSIGGDEGNAVRTCDLARLISILSKVAEESSLAAMLFMDANIYGILLRLLAERCNITTRPQTREAFTMPYTGASLAVNILTLPKGDQSIVCAATRMLSALMEHEVTVSFRRGGKEACVDMWTHSVDTAYKAGVWHIAISLLENAIEAMREHGPNAWYAANGTVVNILGVVGYMLREENGMLLGAYSEKYIEHSCGVLATILFFANEYRISRF